MTILSLKRPFSNVTYLTKTLTNVKFPPRRWIFQTSCTIYLPLFRTILKQRTLGAKLHHISKLLGTHGMTGLRLRILPVLTLQIHCQSHQMYCLNVVLQANQHAGGPCSAV